MDLLFLAALLPVILALILLVIFVLPAIRVMPVIWAFTLYLQLLYGVCRQTHCLQRT